MVGLAKLFSYYNKILATLLFKLLPELLRLIVLALFILLKNSKHSSSWRKYTSMMNKNCSKFAYEKANSEDGCCTCTICLSEFMQGDEAREVVDCRHVFHSLCLEKWLRGARPTCPLCRGSVVPEIIAEEYHEMQSEQEDDGIEKEFALILLKALHGGTCRQGWIYGGGWSFLWDFRKVAVYV